MSLWDLQMIAFRFFADFTHFGIRVVYYIYSSHCRLQTDSLEIEYHSVGASWIIDRKKSKLMASCVFFPSASDYEYKVNWKIFIRR